MAAMEWPSPQAVVRASIIWHSKDGEPWLVSLDFAQVQGRIECVGMAMRSYLAGEAQDELGDYRSYLRDPVSRTDIVPARPALPELTLADPNSRAAYLRAVEEQEMVGLHPAMHDHDAVDALLHEDEPWAPRTSPRALRSTTLRDLPLGDLLSRVRRRVAEQWRSGLLAPRELAASAACETAEPQTASSLPPSEQQRALLRAREELEDQTWKLLALVRERGGYDDELIRRRDDLALGFAELDAKEHPERERAREIEQQIRQIERQLEEAAQHNLAGAQCGPQIAELTLRLTELEDRRMGQDSDLAQAVAQQRPVFLDTERFMRLTQEAASSFALPGQKTGRPPHYSRAQLELVAKTYREAYEAGSSSPTKDVAVKLGMTRPRAAKLVMRCRDPRVGLLRPTAKRKAGEARPSPSDAADPRANDS
jgi:hypothetical protein